METKIVYDTLYGYKRIDPIPTKEELGVYYKEKYFKLIENGDRAQELHRQKKGGKEAKEELEWLNKTLYKDILDTLEKFVDNGRRLLDVGSGAGAFLRFARNNGWKVIGVEPSDEGVGMSLDADIPMYNMTLDEFAKSKHGEFSAITLLNVLEHVPNPVEVLMSVRNLVVPDGIVCIRVPNDFSEMQIYAGKKIGKKRWWVVTPDHINYFDFESLRGLLNSVGLDVVLNTTDFPMEMFLMMGDDYVGNQALGTECHKKRRNFEMAMPDELRRAMYKMLASIGIGRSCIVYAKRKSR